MSTYSNRLQPALQNLLQRVVWFFHLRSSCTTHISADIFGGRKSLVKPAMQQKTYNYIELFGSSTRDRHDDAYIGGRSENNINASCMTILGGRTKQLDIFCCVTGFTTYYCQFCSCVTYSVLSQSHSICQFCHHFPHSDENSRIYIMVMAKTYCRQRPFSLSSLSTKNTNLYLKITTHVFLIS